MTCKDCLHYERCKKLGIFNLETLSVCEDFTARSEWVHLPCKVGDKVYIVKPLSDDCRTLYIKEDVVKKIVFDKSEDTGVIHSRIEFSHDYSVPDWLFQNIFHTHEEAKKALKEKTRNQTSACPFCGGKVNITHGKTGVPFWFFKCEKCGAITSFNNNECNYNPERAKEYFERRAK